MREIKKIIALLVALCMMFSFVSCGTADTKDEEGENAVQEQTEDVTEPSDTQEQVTNEEPLSEDPEKTIVIYFSRVGNTDFPEGTDAVSSASLILENGELKGNAQKIAEIIADKEGADLFEIQVKDPYPVDYNETVNQASDEQSDDARPELANSLEGLNEYSTAYLVFPNWWGDLPMAVYTFFDEYDFSGKTINVFATHEGSRFSGTVGTVSELEPDAIVNEGLAIRGSDAANSEQEIEAWLSENK